MTYMDTHSTTSSQELADGQLPLDLQDGVTSDQFGQEAVPANLSLPLADKRARMMKDICGLTGSGSSESANQMLFSESKSRQPSEQQKVQKCKRCGEEKLLSSFYINRVNGKEYHRNQCNSCEVLRVVSQRKLNKAISNEYGRTWRAHNRGSLLTSLAKRRSKVKNIPFSLDATNIQKIIDKGVCQLTGIPFNLTAGKTWDSPSLDQISPGKGYTVENTRVIILAANVMMNNWGHNKILEVADAIRQNSRYHSDCLQLKLEENLKNLLPTGGWMKSQMTWKARATPLLRRYCQLVVLVRRTKETGYGLWATPRACSAMAATLTPERANEKNPNLEQQICAALWATSRCADSNNMNNSQEVCEKRFKQGRATLAEAVQTMWPTPNASDNRDRGNYSNPSVQRRIVLGKQIGLTTLTKSVGLNAQTEKRGQLNPAFVCWLMGYPQNYEKLLYTVMETQ